MISMAGDGAILITEDGQNIKMGTPKGKVVNSVGAGDSMVAGFITGYIRGGNYEEALKTNHQGHSWKLSQMANDALTEDIKKIIRLAGSEGKA